ncbi:hypothetical protein ES705_04332 [subsurface metagenome]
MSETVVNLNSIFRGDSREYLLTFTRDDGSAIDISEWKVYFTVKKNYRDDDIAAVIKKDISVHYDPVNGKTKISLLPMDTDIVPGNYFYDIQVKRATNDIITVLAGKVEIKSDVTRRTD